MRFSLILCTVNRSKEVKEFLNSLVSQSYKDFEVILVDQNKDSKVLKIIEEFQILNIKYFQSTLGLSKSRNKGLKNATGEIVCFPDDDCTYPDILLENINSFFLKNNYGILMGKTIDKDTKKIVAGKINYFPSILNPNNLLGSSTTLFIKNNIKINFDEQFGLGALFNAEEENDLVFILLKSGVLGYYNPDINYVYHPPSDLDYKNLKRVKERSIGLGAFIAKHILSINGMKYFMKYNLVRPLSGSVLYLMKLDFIMSKYYYIRFIGIWTGFFKYLNNHRN